MPSASERLLRSVLDSIQELAVLADSQGRIREFNRACEALTGYGREEVLGKELVPTFVPDRWIEAVGSRFVDPSAPDAREPHEYAWRTRSGEERPIRWRCTPVAIPGEASPWTLGLGRDAAEERKLDSTLRSRARLLERFFDSALSCAVILDPQFNFLRVNTAYADACGRSVADFPGRNLFEMYPSDAKAIFEEVVRSGKPHSIQGRPFEFPDHPEWGVTYWDWTLVPVLDDDGGVECLILCLHDTTAHRRAADSLRRALALVDSQSRELERIRETERRRLALELHDEMGQELTALKLSIEDLHPPDAVAPGALDRALAIILRLQARVRTISSHLRPPMLEEMGLAAALTWLFERLRTSLATDVSFRHSGLEARLPAEVELTLYRIAQEALTNVVRHSGTRSAQVLVRATASTVVMKVEDVGCGFEPDRHANAHDGLGLTGMSVRARRLGGRLEIESAPGVGTSLTVELPLARKGRIS